MASIHHEILVEVRPESAWAAIRDVGAIHERLVPGFVVDCRLEGEARIVTFANGLVAREVIVDIDDKDCRLVWSAAGGQLTHHNASLQVLAEGAEHCRVVWIADFLPNALTSTIDPMIKLAMNTMKKTIERHAANR